MKQALLEHRVARATGESVRRIRRIGFSLVVPRPAGRPPRTATPAQEPTRSN